MSDLVPLRVIPPPVPEAMAEELRKVILLYADEVRGRLACSPEVAALVTLAACQMAVTTFVYDVQPDYGHRVTDRHQWRGDGQ